MNCTAAIPFLIREGCCGGGRRIDLEFRSRQFPLASEVGQLVQDRVDQFGLAAPICFRPAESIHVPTKLTDNFGLWSSFAGQLCLAWHR